MDQVPNSVDMDSYQLHTSLNNPIGLFREGTLVHLVFFRIAISFQNGSAQTGMFLRLYMVLRIRLGF
jgi:hypothetical protein